MNRQKLLNTFKANLVARGQFKSELELTEDLKIEEDLGLDSLDRVELTLDLERALEIEIPDDDIEKYLAGAVKKAITYLEKLTK